MNTIKPVIQSQTYQVVASNETRDESRWENREKNGKRKSKTSVPAKSQKSDASQENSSLEQFQQQIVDSNKWVELVSHQPNSPKKPVFEKSAAAKFSSALKKLNRTL